MFCGHTFASGSDALISYAPTASPYGQLTIKNAIFDELYATVADVSTFDGIFPDDWTFDTRLHALFNGDLMGGNISFTETVVESVRIKRRTPKDTKFRTIFEKSIKVNEDFAIELLDYLEPAGTIEYAYVPVISGGEGDYIISKVESSFDHYFICEKNQSYPMALDSVYSQQINYETVQVKPLGRKYPINIVNGQTGYKSGDMESLFIDLNDDDPNIKDSLNYREIIYQMFTNGRPKILKDTEGNLLLISVTGNLTESDRNYLYYGENGFFYVKSKFSWIECGDAYNIGDLYDNNLIDTELDRW